MKSNHAVKPNSGLGLYCMNYYGSDSVLFFVFFTFVWQLSLVSRGHRVFGSCNIEPPHPSQLRLVSRLTVPLEEEVITSIRPADRQEGSSGGSGEAAVKCGNCATQHFSRQWN